MAIETYQPSYQNTITITNNREVNPRLKLYCSSSSSILKYIRNDTTGRQTWLNYTIRSGERLTVDFDPLNFGAISSFYGDVTGRAMLRGSDFTQLKLLSGVNLVSILVTGGGTVEASLEWPLRHWSADGVYNP
jgi:hypothetical protein